MASDDAQHPRIKAREIRNITQGGPANQGQHVFFTCSFMDGGEASFGCALSLLPVLLGNLSEYGRQANMVRTKAQGRHTGEGAPYFVTEVTRSGHTPGGEHMLLEFATNHGFPVQVAMTPDQARQTIEFLQREMLLAATPQGDGRN